MVDDLHRALRRMWDTRDQWDENDDLLAPVVEIIRETLGSGGVSLSREPDGSWHARFLLPG
jgi:hypothetical protein